MSYKVGSHSGVTIDTDDATFDDLLLIHLDDGTFWAIVARQLPVKQFVIDPEFAPEGVTAWELPTRDLTTTETPDLRWWLCRMRMLDDDSQKVPYYELNEWPNVTRITAVKRQRLRKYLSARTSVGRWLARPW